MYAPRKLSAEMREEFKSEASSGGGVPEMPPYVLKRSEGLKLLDGYWDTFRHEGEVAGPRERLSSGSTLGWRVEDRERCWDNAWVASPVSRSPRAGTYEITSKTWLIDSGCAFDLLDSRHVPAYELGRIKEKGSAPVLWTANGLV